MGKINSRAKGGRGERAARDYLMELWSLEEVTRALQRSGKGHGEDQVPDLYGTPNMRVEVKWVENLSYRPAMLRAVAEAEASGTDDVAMVLWKKNRKPWTMTMLQRDLTQWVGVVSSYHNIPMNVGTPAVLPTLDGRCLNGLNVMHTTAKAINIRKQLQTLAGSTHEADVAVIVHEVNDEPMVTILGDSSIKFIKAIYWHSR